MNDKSNLYIVCCYDSYCGVYLGFLPLSLIPKKSILREAIFNNELAVRSNGLDGVYEKKSYAKAHLSLEKKWRCTPEVKFITYLFWIIEIKAKDIKKMLEKGVIKNDTKRKK